MVIYDVKFFKCMNPNYKLYSGLEYVKVHMTRK